jgi:hypothetical protein
MMPAFRYELSKNSTDNLKKWEAKYIGVIERLMESFNKITLLSR